MNPYFCERCKSRFKQDGDCEFCHEEVLLDLRDDDVIQLLEDFDDSRFRKRTGLYSLGVGILSLPIFLGTPYVDFRGILCAYIACLLIGTAILTHLFPPEKKCPPLAARQFID